MANPYEYRGNGQGFLTDYSDLGAAGSFFEGAIKGYQDTQDRSMKRLEMQAQIEAVKTKADREKFQSQMDAAKEGYMQGPDGSLQQTALSPKVQGEHQLKAIGEGVKSTGKDLYGNDTGYEADPSSPKMQQIKSQFALANQRMGMQGDRLEETRNQNAIKAGKSIDEDTVMKDMQTARYSLSRGKALLEGNMPLTYNNMNAVQQDVINGMTKGGQSSEGKVSREMQESWIGRWNNVMAKAGQYGPQADIRKQDPGLFRQVQGLLNEVDGTIGQNMADRTKTLAGSYRHSSNQKVQKTIDDKIKQYAPEPGGLVPQGLVPSGKVGGAPAKDPQIDQYAQSNGLSYEAAANIINARKAKMNGQ